MIDFNLITRSFTELKKRRIKLITAESLTGGLILAEFTKIPGSSEVVWGGFITYSPQAKIKLVGVNPEIIEKYGVVSKETAEEMALGALNSFLGKNPNIPQAIAIAVTGVAGPDSLEGKPVGTVFMGIADSLKRNIECKTVEFHFSSDRNRIREKTVESAAKELFALIRAAR